MAIKIPVSQKYLVKEICYKEADRLINQEKKLKMSVDECAKEIHAHAMMYYMSNVFKSYPFHLPFSDYINKHAKDIDLEDGGDTKERKLIYETIWKLSDTIEKIVKTQR